MKAELLAVASLAMLLMAMFAVFQPVYGATPSISWNPSSIFYTTATAGVGTKFNVTIWVENAPNVGGAQVYVEFNDTILRVTRWFEPRGDPQYIFNGRTTSALPTPPNDPGYSHLGPNRGRVLVSVSLFPPNPPYFTGNGKICTFEFNITKVPTNPGKFTSALMINTDETLMVDGDTGGEVPGVVKTNGYYEISNPEVPPKTFTLAIEATMGGSTDPAVGTYTYPEGSLVIVVAKPDDGLLGYGFDHWELDGLDFGTTGLTAVLMDANHALRAVFVRQYDINIQLRCLDQFDEMIQNFGNQGCFPLSTIISLEWFADHNHKKYGGIIPPYPSPNLDDWKYSAAATLGHFAHTNKWDGTDPNDMVPGIDKYLKLVGLDGKFTVTLFTAPTFGQYDMEMRGEVVILLLAESGKLGQPKCAYHAVAAFGTKSDANRDGTHNIGYIDTGSANPDGSHGKPVDTTWTSVKRTYKRTVTQDGKPKTYNVPINGEVGWDVNGDGKIDPNEKGEVAYMISISPKGDPPGQTLYGYVVQHPNMTYIINATTFGEVFTDNGTVYGVPNGTVYQTTAPAYGFANGTVIVEGTYEPVNGTVYIINGLLPIKYIVPHDTAISNITSSKTVVGEGFSTTANVTVENQGNYTETFKVTICANATSIASQNITLSSENSVTITFVWNTAGFAKGNYTISAYATLVPGETDTTDNTRTDGPVYVGIPGDVNGDGKVDLKDVYTVAAAYGSYGPSYLYPGSLPHPRWKPECDIKNQNKVDLKDFYITCSNYGKTAP